MKEILKQILNEIKDLKTTQANTDQKIEMLTERTDKKIEEIAGRTDQKIEMLTERTDKKIEEIAGRTDQKIEMLTERIGSHDRSNKDEFKQLSKKIDSITEVIVMTMENITELNGKIKKQDVEIRVIKGGK